MSSQNPGCLGFLFRLFGGSESRLPDKLPYRIRDDFLSRAELSLYGVLRLAVGDQWVICPKVNLSDIFYVVGEEKQSWRNRIDRKHLDFLLCDAQTMQPVLGVELDDRSHARRDRQESDAFKDKVFRAAGLPLVRIQARANYSVTEISTLLRSAMSPTSQAANPPAPTPKTGTQAPSPGAPICPKCGVAMVVRASRKDGSRFYGCPNFPRCRHTAPLVRP